MRKFDIRKLQLKEMELVLEVDRICKNHDIKYYLSWGSALGSVRHKGFIPWDDDIDVSMFWSDYIKFKEVCKEELQDKFFYQSQETDKNIWLTWDKIRINDTTSMDRELNHMKCHWGICMDIFPIITIPASESERKDQQANLRKYKFLCNKPFVLNSKDTGAKAKVKKLIYKMMPDSMVESLKKTALENIVKYENDKYNMCGEILSMSYEKSLIKKDIYGTPKYVEFEGNSLPIPEKYDEYLTSCYGDYMELPPESERIGHGDIIVDLDNSFEKYTKN